MFGKLAILFAVLAIIALLIATAVSFGTSQLQSVDKTCGPLKSFHVYKNELTIRDSLTGLEQKYKAGDQQFCMYAFNYHVEYGYWGWIALGFAIATIVMVIVHYSNKETQEPEPNSHVY